MSVGARCGNDGGMGGVVPVLAACLLVAGCSGGTHENADRAEPRGPGWIVFNGYQATPRSSGFEYYAIRPDGSGLRKLRVSWRDELGIAPGGRFIATIRMSFAAGARDELFVSRPDGSERRRVPLPAEISAFPAVSPDGKRVVVIAGADEHLATVAVTGDDLRRLPTPEEVEDVTWSPDGERIAVASRLRRSDGTWAEVGDIYVVSADGSKRRRVARGLDPAWSPDGRRIAFVDGRGRIRIVDSDGGAPVFVGSRGRLPTWSPDAKRLAFLRDTPCGHVGCSRIFVVHARGGHARRIGPKLAEAGVLTWTTAEIPAAPVLAAERARAAAYAEDFARACRPPCRVHSLERISPRVWRVHLNFATGYCVLLDLAAFRRTGAGTHTGWRHTNCVGPPRRRA